MPSNYQSKGSVLVLTLVILLLVELIAVTTVSSVNITSHVLRNHEKIQALNRDADNLINYVITNKDYFLSYSDYINAEGKFDIAIPHHLVAPPRSGEITQFECTNCQFAFAKASSVNKFLSLHNTYWILKIEVSDLQVGAAVVVGQGLSVNMHSHTEAHISYHSKLFTAETLQMSVQGTWWYSRPLAINRRE